jgi:hypothetical protein
MTEEKVTSCCGFNPVESQTSNCCDASFWLETDICSKCKEHADTLEYCGFCENYDDTWQLITVEEYKQNKNKLNVKN